MDSISCSWQIKSSVGQKHSIFSGTELGIVVRIRDKHPSSITSYSVSQIGAFPYTMVTRITKTTLNQAPELCYIWASIYHCIMVNLIILIITTIFWGKCYCYADSAGGEMRVEGRNVIIYMPMQWWILSLNLTIWFQSQWS